MKLSELYATYTVSSHNVPNSVILYQNGLLQQLEIIIYKHNNAAKYNICSLTYKKIVQLSILMIFCFSSVCVVVMELNKEQNDAKEQEAFQKLIEYVKA